MTPDSQVLTRRSALALFASLPVLCLQGCVRRKADDPGTVAEQYLRALYEGDAHRAAAWLDNGDPSQKRIFELNLKAMAEQFSLLAAERWGFKQAKAHRVWKQPADPDSQEARAAAFVVLEFQSGYESIERVDLVKRPASGWGVDPFRRASRGEAKKGVNLNF